jgi:hypothetical protein
MAAGSTGFFAAKAKLLLNSAEIKNAAVRRLNLEEFIAVRPHEIWLEVHFARIDPLMEKIMMC